MALLMCDISQDRLPAWPHSGVFDSYRGYTAATVHNSTLKNLYFLHLSRVGILFFNLSIYKKAVATYLFHSLQLNEQATPLLRPEIHNQLIKPLRCRGKIPCQALDA